MYTFNRIQKKGKQFFLVALIFYSGITLGQVKAPQITPLSPNAAALWKYTELPVNLYTGIPSISIPIYEIKSGNLTVPVSISYHAGGIRFEEQASWVGLGWTLNAGGAISRNVKGIADEKGILYSSNQFLTTLPTCPTEYFTNVQNKVYDVQPDEFSYNMPGKNGRFIFKQGVEQPITIPYDPVKFNYTYSYPDLSKIEILDESGTTFRFGNYKHHNTPVLEATNGGSGVFAEENFPSSWLLTEMETADLSDTIAFNYAAGEDAVQKNTLSQHISVLDESYGPSIQEGCPSRTTPSISYFSTTNLTYETSTQYLSEIIFKNGKVQFIQSSSYRTDLFENQKSLEYIKVYALDNGNYKLVKTVKLLYSYFKKSVSSVQTDWKLKLDKIQMLDNDGIVKEEYGFQYVTDVFTADADYLPEYAVDYWGYYNGQTGNTNMIPRDSIDYTTDNAHNTRTLIGGANRSTSPTYMTEGVLKKITYPTGGTTEFEFETNRYYEDGQTKYAGGIRVKKIRSTSSDTLSAFTKTYKYGLNGDGFGYKNFNTNLGLFVSHNREIVRWDACFPPCDPNYYTVRSYNSTSSMQIDGSDGSPVLYPYVTEYSGTETSNIGKTVYIYDHGSPEPDDIYLIYGPNTSSFQRQSNHWQRGNLTSKTIYARSGQKISKTTSNYDIIHPIYETVGLLVHEHDHLICSFGGQCAQFLGAQPFQYNYYSVSSGVSKLISNADTLYDAVDSSRFVSTSTSYVYDSNYLQPTEITKQTGSNEQNVNFGKYPNHYTFTSTPSGADAAGIKYLQDKHIYTAPIEQYTVKKVSTGGTVDSKVIAGIINTYVSGSPQPQKIWQIETASPIPLGSFTPSSLSSNAFSKYSAYKPKLTFQFDSSGNISEYAKENDIKNSFVWGYKRTNVVAQVIGASFSSVMATSGLNQSVIQNPSSSKALRDEIDKIRTAFPSALVTTYTHKPLIGISSQTDPNGKNSYYEYDSSGRLISIRDQDSLIIKKICYNYAGQPEDCGGFYNVQKTGSFTRSCPGGYTGSSVTYTVPARKYASYFSQAIVDQMAQDDVNANGQAYANSHGTCISDAVTYAKIEVELSSSYNDGCVYYDMYDVYIRFYSDAGGTTPVSVYNLNVNYSDGTTPYTATNCSGTQVYLGPHVLYSGDCYPEGGPFYVNYYVTSGTGYTPL